MGYKILGDEEKLDVDLKQAAINSGIAGGIASVSYAIEHIFYQNEKRDDFDVEKIKGKLKTEPDTAYFWSGRTDGVGGAETAKNIAKSNGGVTLEYLIEKENIDIPEWDFNKPETMKAWQLASDAYAEQVSGNVTAVVGKNLRDGNIWENVELPRLKNNDNVSKITIIDPKTNEKSIIFER